MSEAGCPARLPRQDGRSPSDLRGFEIRINPLPQAEGSALIRQGLTEVICTASVEQRVPSFRRGSGLGWLTAEYRMLPRATDRRSGRDGSRPDGRAIEIQRLIGRSLRSAVDFARLGEHTIFVDCDVIRADGGTRTAAITAGMVAVALAVEDLRQRRMVGSGVLTTLITAISAGSVDGAQLLDLDYSEDSRAEVDMNVVMDSLGRIVESQSSAERRAIGREEHTVMLDLAESGIRRLLAAQRQALAPLEIGSLVST